MCFYFNNSPLLPWGTLTKGFSQQQQQKQPHGNQALQKPTSSPQQLIPLPIEGSSSSPSMY
jgi:hypothetical protein